MRVMVIMAGGSGERFWPLSRRRRPKQLLPLTGEESMLAATVERARATVGGENVYVVAGEALMPRIRVDLGGFPEENFLCEPVGKNTAPCLAFAAGVIGKRHGAETLMGVLTADHLIGNIEVFSEDAGAAFDCAEREGKLMTIGIKPTHANTGFGYLELGPSIGGGEEGLAREVLSFREKPDEETARGYLERGNFLWNSGMFFWKIGDLMEAFRQCCPELARGAVEIGEALGGEDFREVVRRVFRQWPSISIDYAVMEKSGNVGAVASRFDWDDVGTWTALSRIHSLDEAGNLIVGDCLAVDAKRCILHNQGLAGGGEGGEGDPSSLGAAPLVAALGVEDLIVVVSDGAVLVCHRDREQDIKKLLAAVREKGRDEVL